jgi:hypothetical protein
LLVREDDTLNELWSIGQVVQGVKLSRQDEFAESYRAKFATRGHVIDADIYRNRLRPPLDHTVEERDLEGDEYRTHRIRIDGVIIRYVEDMHEIAVTVEGNLRPEKLEILKRHGVETYAKLEGVPYKCMLVD